MFVVLCVGEGVAPTAAGDQVEEFLCWFVRAFVCAFGVLECVFLGFMSV